MSTITMIDVTVLAPAEKHPAIFSKFDELSDGETMVIHNDHDPKPVYYQLLGERGHCFTWAYLSKGPETWEVEIKKLPAVTGEPTIGQMVAEDIRKAEVFKKLGIDFCCGGKKTVRQACAEKGMEEKTVFAELENIGERNRDSPDFEKWKLSLLADYIIQQHHGYIRQNEQIITELTGKVAVKHGVNNPVLVTIYEKVAELMKELLTHMKKEEIILFPYIKKLEETKGADNVSNSLESAINVMERDHDLAGELMREIRSLAKNYVAPANACNSHKLMLYKLEEFENDLFRHVHLENNILFPGAIALEQ